MSILEKLFLTLPQITKDHCRQSSLYNLLDQVCRKETKALFSDKEATPKPFGPFGDLVFPYHSMGAIDTLDLFGLDELILFSFYWIHRTKYQRAADIGANLGLHSILFNRCGFEVRSFEPDPRHFEILKKNLVLNQCLQVEPFNAAVSSHKGEMEFIRVLGNTTGSHLAGAKQNPYGELDRFPVQVESIGSILQWADLIKLDAEGHEKEIILATEGEQWRSTDAFVEVENEENAVSIYEHLKKQKVNLFSQKINWKRVQDVGAMPTSYREGMLFVSCKEEMPWG